jgi:uncharacterized protein YggL (DUF469 family)
MSRSHHRANRRQRKKMHLGEFQELGFMVDAKLAGGQDAAQRDSLLYRFLLEAVEANGLAFGGGMNSDFSGFVVSGKAYGKVEESHRELVRAWLESQGVLQQVQVGELRDAWYGWG